MTDRKLWMIAGIGAVAGIIGLGSMAAVRHSDQAEATRPKRSIQATATPKPAEFSTACAAGANALGTLKGRAVVTLGGTGSATYVAAINGYRANESRHEYWAFYINGALSDHSAASYVCHDGDKLAWKITAY